MTLNIYTSGIKNSAELWIDADEDGGKEMEGVTWVMGMCTVRTGMPRLTDQNAGEFLRRLRVLEEVYGPLMNMGPKPVLFTEEQVRRRIGMRTNATPLTKARFEKNMAEERRERSAS